MNDLIFIAVTIAFFAVAALYVKFCDSIVRSDATADDMLDESPVDEGVAA